MIPPCSTFNSELFRYRYSTYFTDSIVLFIALNNVLEYVITIFISDVQLSFQHLHDLMHCHYNPPVKDHLLL
jgi:hypothetical protein